MPRYTFVTETFDCSKTDLPKKLEAHKLDLKFKNGGDAPAGTLAATNGLSINGVNTFAIRSAAEQAIAVRAFPGGEALAVRLAEPHPDTGSAIDHQTGERRMVWLVGAKCLDVPLPQARTAFRRS
jgi:hypothetical protein